MSPEFYMEGTLFTQTKTTANSNFYY